MHYNRNSGALFDHVGAFHGMLRWLFLIPLLLPQVALADGSRLIETFRFVCVDTFPSFEGMSARVTMRGGRFETQPGVKLSLVPFVIPEMVKKGGVGKEPTNSSDYLFVEYARGSVFDRPAAGCTVASRRPFDETSVALLLEGFESTHFIGDFKEEIFLVGLYRAWLVGLDDGRAILTVHDAWFDGKVTATYISLVRLDEALIDQGFMSDNMP